MFSVESQVDLSRFSDAMRSLEVLASTGAEDSEIRAGLANEADAYMDFIRRRFQSASQGDGTWPDLSPRTKYERARKAAGGFKRTKGITFADRMQAAMSGSFPILYITGNSYGSLLPGAPGSFIEFGTDRVQVGSTVDHFKYHQRGGGTLPQREILVMPDSQTLDVMTQRIGAGWAAAVYAKLATV